MKGLRRRAPGHTGFGSTGSHVQQENRTSGRFLPSSSSRTESAAAKQETVKWLSKEIQSRQVPNEVPPLIIHGWGCPRRQRLMKHIFLCHTVVFALHQIMTHAGMSWPVSLCFDCMYLEIWRLTSDVSVCICDVRPLLPHRYQLINSHTWTRHLKWNERPLL